MSNKIMIDRREDMINKAGHILYDNINNIEWEHLPKPISDYYDEIIRYCYLGNNLYLFKITGINVLFSEYFMVKDDSPWNALRNYYKWNNYQYDTARNWNFLNEREGSYDK